MAAQACKTTTCISPFLVDGDIPVPCGRCENCKVRKISQWSFRLSIEEKNCCSAWFLTLTYDTDHVPITKQGFMSLRYKHVQNFLKLIRKKQDEKIIYFCVGEYGTKKGRPHYHLIIFNLKNVQNVIENWEHGEVYFGSVTSSSVGYVLKYILKSPKYRYYKNDDREPCKARMSKGLGKDYITPNTIGYHSADVTQRNFCTVPGGQKVSIPRYYRDKIYNEEQKAELQKHLQENPPQDIYQLMAEKYPDDWPRILLEIRQLQESITFTKSNQNRSL